MTAVQARRCCRAVIATRLVRRAMKVAAACALVAAIPLAAAGEPSAADPVSVHRIVVAFADRPEPAPAAGSTPRGYDGLPSYAGSQRANHAAARIAHDYGLREVSAWTIEPLQLRCMLFELPLQADRDDMLARLRRDARVQLAQPLQEFSTYAGDAHIGAPATAPPAAAAVAFNDPYFGLQHGFAAIDAGSAQRWSDGSGIRVAIVDTGVDAAHPDLAGRIVVQRDFVTDRPDARAGNRHGTEVAGVIVAVANNGLGIVGVAPGTRILSYRACWPVRADDGAARCDTFTLAQALGAAIASGAPLINLSLGGPADPLLEQLLAFALAHGRIVVGALPPGGRTDGFPVDVAGVVAVGSAGDPLPAGSAALAAPGRDILTLEPGGHYDYASGSSLAAAHVTGAIALLLGLDRHLAARSAWSLLEASRGGAGATIDACKAVQALGHAQGTCTAVAARPEPGRATR